MKCPDCDAADPDCFRCDGSGELCDECGEATNDLGQNICDDCLWGREKDQD